MAKVRFWEQQDFYGIDFSPLARDAKDEVFGQPVVGGFDARTLLSPAFAYAVDFRTVTQKEIQDIVIPFTWVAQYTGIGIDCTRLILLYRTGTWNRSLVRHQSWRLYFKYCPSCRKNTLASS